MKNWLLVIPFLFHSSHEWQGHTTRILLNVKLLKVFHLRFWVLHHTCWTRVKRHSGQVSLKLCFVCKTAMQIPGL